MQKFLCPPGQKQFLLLLKCALKALFLLPCRIKLCLAYLSLLFPCLKYLISDILSGFLYLNLIHSFCLFSNSFIKDKYFSFVPFLKFLISACLNFFSINS